MGGGTGIFVPPGFPTSALSLTRTTIGPQPYAAVWIGGAGAYELHDNDLSGSLGILLSSWPAHGNAIFATNGVQPWDGAYGLLLDGNRFHSASDTAIFLHDASATFRENIFDTNIRDVVQQQCEALTPLNPDAITGISTARVCTGGTLLYDNSLRFDGLFLSEAGIER